MDRPGGTEIGFNLQPTARRWGNRIDGREVEFEMALRSSSAVRWRISLFEMKRRDQSVSWDIFQLKVEDVE